MVVLLATGAVPAAVAGLLAAGALILTRVLSIEQAYKGINWTTVVLVGGMIPLSTAMQASGAADKVADRLPNIVGDRGVSRAGHLGATSADVRHGGVIGGTAHARGDAGQLDGHGARRVSLRRLAKLGLPLLAWYFVVSVGLVPVFWKF